MIFGTARECSALRASDRLAATRSSPSIAVSGPDIQRLLSTARPGNFLVPRAASRLQTFYSTASRPKQQLQASSEQETCGAPGRKPAAPARGSVTDV